MPTRLHLAVSEGAAVDVDEGFDESIEKVFPMQEPLEKQALRAQHIFHSENRRIMVQPANIYMVEEL